jgi:endonuclease YncB( thermonuclease family)
VRKLFLVMFLALSCTASAEPIDSTEIRVIDGDTIRVRHKQPNARLVGFNAPETR